jgi:acyl-coenzyme A synthetase/AMP-(fatty) acid ligase
MDKTTRMSVDLRRIPWNREIPEYFNIGSACTDALLDSPVADRVAMIVADDSLGTSSSSYRDLAHRTDRFGQLLRNLETAAGERVLVRLPNCLDYPTAFLGSMKAGAISVPTSTLLVAEEVRYLAENSGASILVTHKSMWEELGRELKDYSGGLRHVLLSGEGPMPESSGYLQLHELEQELSTITHWDDPFPTRAHDPAYLVYTSGTTGHPKGVLHAHRALLGRLPAARHWFDFGEEDRILHSGKFNWTYALGTAMMDPLYQGKTVVVHEGATRAVTWLKLIAAHGCTTFIGVPRIYRQIVQYTSLGAGDVPTLRHCMSAGEHLSDDLRLAWRERFDLEIYEGLGMSECSYYISQDKRHPIRLGSAGRIQPGHTVALLDENHSPVPDGKEGMICVAESDPGLFLGYWNQGGETKSVNHDGWFFTGDYARRDEDGYIWFLGRRDDIINTFGYRVSPQEIERVMKTHPDVADCVAIGQEMEEEKTLVALCVILESGSKTGSKELLDFAGLHLAAYKRPRMVHILEEFPRTRNGKVLRSEIKQEIETQPAQ